MLFKTSSEDCDRKAGKLRAIKSKYPCATHLSIALQVAFILCLVRLPASAQTISIKDLPRLVASVRALDEGDSGGYTTRSFQSWCIDSVGGPSAVSKYREWGDGLVWLFSTHGQLSAIDWKGYEPLAELSGRRFVFLSAVGWAHPSHKVLTSWHVVGGDSIVLDAIDIGVYESGSGGLRIRKMVCFPDKSVLMCTETEDKDLCRSYGRFSFLREVSPGDFSIFQDDAWDTFDFREINFDLGHLYNGQYRIIRSTHYLSPDYSDTECVCTPLRPDSARADVIDLWNLAVDFFKLDTARIRR